jgi:putative hydrolase of the HAD superfamily
LKPPPKVLLFDLGGVLVDNVTFEELPKLLERPEPRPALFDRWLASESVRRFERGEIDQATFGEAFVEEWGLRIAPATFLDAFATWPRSPYPGAVDLLSRLRGRATVAILSNCNALHWERLSGLLAHTDAAFSSHLLGLVKPDQAIFRTVADRLACPPGSICFFDDSATNVRAAQSAGMQAHQTVGLESLAATVRSLGLEDLL